MIDLFAVFNALSYLALPAVPAAAAWSTHRNQTSLIEKCRTLYLTAVRAHELGATELAKENLQTIRTIEARLSFQRTKWAVTFRIIAVSLLGGVIYATLKLAAIHAGLSTGLSGKYDMVAFTACLYTVVGGTLTFSARELFTPDFEISNFGDRLHRVLYAGRDIAPAPRSSSPKGDADGLASHQVLGLGPYFSKKDVERAFRRIAKELHPDAHPTANAEKRKATEAAFKRATAARDELLASLV